MQLAGDAELISNAVFYLTDLSICSCIAPFFTIAQQDVLKSGTITLQICPPHSRLLGQFCIHINLGIFYVFSSVKGVSNEGYIAPVKALCGGSLLTMVLLICKHGRSFHLSVSSVLL